MKTVLFALALVLPFAAQADFVPGRVRPDAVAQMEVTKATGKYRKVKKVTLYSLDADGQPGIVGFRAEVGREEIQFNVTNLKRSLCGTTIEAISLENVMGTESSTLSLVDMRGAACERYSAYDWSPVTLVTQDYSTGEESTIEMQGKPEALMRTQGMGF